MANNPSANLSPLVSREHVGNEIGKSLRLYVGRGRRYSVKQLSNATGVKDRVIECALIDAGSVDYRPLPLEALLSISLFLGADFTTEWLSTAGQGAFDLPDADDPNPGQFAADASEDSTEIVKRAIDGEFCSDDKVALRLVGQRQIARGMHLVSAAKRRAVA